jgi:hypothetical protein
MLKTTTLAVYRKLTPDITLLPLSKVQFISSVQIPSNLNMCSFSRPRYQATSSFFSTLSSYFFTVVKELDPLNSEFLTASLETANKVTKTGLLDLLRYEAVKTQRKRNEFDILWTVYPFAIYM